MTATPVPPAPPLRPVAHGVPAYSQTLSLIPASVALARTSARTTLSCWGLDSLRDDVAVIVSELVTNAVQHAAPVAVADDPGRCRLTLERRSVDTVRIVVVDRSCRRLDRRRPGPDAEAGRGLAVVAGLASRWGVTETRDGKQVWAELRVSGP
ncbi:ATP-binding protein [Streptomyces sp. NPDC007861]|uniref:ATP-binding protein n=1 Tax=Streptomyces sp. NPDC007861 TaxID=3154893 RepID=UPI0034103252